MFVDAAVSFCLRLSNEVETVAFWRLLCFRKEWICRLVGRDSRKKWIGRSFCCEVWIYDNERIETFFHQLRKNWSGICQAEVAVSARRSSLDGREKAGAQVLKAVTWVKNSLVFVENFASGINPACTVHGDHVGWCVDLR